VSEIQLCSIGEERDKEKLTQIDAFGQPQAAWRSGSHRMRVACWDERGNTESALVLIPLIFLFLIAMQLLLAIGMRDADSMVAGDQASVRAISGVFASADEEEVLSSPDRFSNIALLVTRQSRKIPQLVPGITQLLGRDLVTDARGIAIIENTR
jgi:hypothetical protein